MLCNFCDSFDPSFRSVRFRAIDLSTCIEYKYYIILTVISVWKTIAKREYLTIVKFLVRTI
jgi:hypothetical protein